MRLLTTRSRLSIVIPFLIASSACTLPVEATTWRDVEVTCPIDSIVIRARVPNSIFMSGYSPTLRPQGVGVDPFVASIIQCPQCGFAAHAEQFRNVNALDRDAIAAALQKLKSPRLFLRNDAAILVEQLTGRNEKSIARLSLASKWIADDTGDPEVIRDRTTQAVRSHQDAFDRKDIPDGERTAIAYVTGELLRESERNEEAIRWFDRALQFNDLTQFPEFMLQGQRMLAAYPVGATPDLITSLREASPAVRVGAVPLLRGSDLPEAISLLTEICLDCEDDLRRVAMWSLIGDAPQERHLPIYLKAIESRHYRTAQNGAHAVELLRATEAAPALGRALQNPPQYAEYRILSALSVLGTEDQIEVLERAAAKGKYTTEILRGILNSRSPKAITPALKMIDKERFSVRFVFSGEHGRQALHSALQIEGLIDQLPDLRTVEANSRRAEFKVLLLGATGTPEASEELAAALESDSRLALQAATELVRNGDVRGNAQFMERLHDVVGKGYETWSLVLPLLSETDFGAVQEALLKVIAEQQQSIAFRREALARASTEDDRRREQKHLDRTLSRTNYWMAPWLRLMGATGHPEARDQLVAFLADTDHQARRAAVLGLLHVYDRSVAEKLLELLDQESTQPVVEAIFEVLGQDESRQPLPAVLEAGRDPMLAPTRIAWIKAVTALGGRDQILSTLKSLSKSPNQSLATAAQSALQKSDQ